MRFKYLSLLAPLALAACGTSTGGPTGSSLPPATTNLPNTSTSTTLPVTPASTAVSQLCSAYYLVLADNVLVGQIVSGTATEAKAASVDYLQALHTLKTSSLSPPALRSGPVIQAMAKLSFVVGASRTPGVPPAALVALSAALGSTCQPVIANSTEAPKMASAAASAGWSSSCNGSAQTLISAADPSYGVIQTQSTAGVTTRTTCAPDGYTGVLERETALDWSAVQAYLGVPCGQAPPFILYSLFGKGALGTCYPS